MSERKLDEANIVDEDLLIALKARETIADPKHWCQHTLHVNSENRHCLLGHIHMHMPGATLGEPWPPQADYRRMDVIARKLGFGTSILAAKFNNSHTHAEVLARFDEGIAVMRGVGK